MRRAALLFVVGASAIVIGLLLVNYQRADISGCNQRGPCEPAIGLPYIVPGAILFVGGVAVVVGAALMVVSHWWRSARRSRA